MDRDQGVRLDRFTESAIPLARIDVDFSRKAVHTDRNVGNAVTVEVANGIRWRLGETGNGKHGYTGGVHLNGEKHWVRSAAAGGGVRHRHRRCVRLGYVRSVDGCL